MIVKNTRIYFASLPKGLPDPNTTYKIVDEDVPTDVPEGSLLLENLWLSLDPYMRLRMRDASIASYFGAFPLNQVMGGGGVSKVLKSTVPEFKEGDYVSAFVGWERYTIAKPAGLIKIYKDPKIPLRWHTSVMGMPGFTAYAGLLHLPELKAPQKGETVFVSAASGAVGHVVGQIAKLRGCYVVGSAGTDEKVEFVLKNCGYDAAFNYKKPPGGSILAALKQLCPKGIDFYFENVGGETLEAVLDVANNNARISVCGLISVYNDVWDGSATGPKNFFQVLGKRIAIKGFIQTDHRAAHWDDFNRDMPEWIRTGQVTYRDDIRWGLENLPEAFNEMLTGKNFGKMVVGLREGQED